MLKGKTIFLRPMKKGDLEEIAPFFADLAVLSSWMGCGSEALLHSRFSVDGFYSKGQGLFLMEKRKQIVGVIGFEEKKNPSCLSLECYIFRKEDRRKGFMTEALLEVVRYLFLTTEHHRVQLLVPDYHKGLIRLAKKCSFQFEGILRSAFFQKGSYVDLCVYSFLRTELAKM